MTQSRTVVLASALAAGLLAAFPSYSQDARIVEGIAAHGGEQAKNQAAAKVRFADSLSQAQRGDAQAQYDVGLTTCPFWGKSSGTPSRRFSGF